MYGRSPLPVRTDRFSSIREWERTGFVGVVDRSTVSTCPREGVEEDGKGVTGVGTRAINPGVNRT